MRTSSILLCWISKVIQHTAFFAGFLCIYTFQIVSAQNSTAQGSTAKKVQPITLFRAISNASFARTPHLQRASEGASQHFKRYELLDIEPETLKNSTSGKNSFSFSLPHSKKNLVINVQPYNPFTSTARLIAKTPEGDVPIALDENFAIYRGTVEGDKTSLVSMSVGSSGLMMTIRTGNETLTLEPFTEENNSVESTQSQQQNIRSEETQPTYVLYSKSDNKQQRTFLCDAEEHSEEGQEREHQSEHVQQLNDKNTTSVQATLQECEMGIDIDFATYQSLGSNQAQAAQYAAAVIAAVSQIYERDINTRLAISHVQVWTITDPYASATRTSTALNQFSQTWNANYTSVNRDLAHLFSVRGLGGGVAYLDVLCNKTRGYGVSANLRTRFPIDPGWTTFVVAHEIGHNFGSRHTHSCWWQGGAIDRCAPAEAVNGQAPCFTQVVASRGTIMSYCHNQPGGNANIDMNFHPLCATYMISRAQAASCLGTSTGGGGGVQVPSIVSFSPTSAGAGAQVVITGSNFTNVTAVRFGGVNAQSYTVNSSSQITAVLGSGATGQIQVITATSSANSTQNFTFTTDVSASVSVLSFAPIRINKESFQTFTLRNNGTAPVVFASTSLTGANASDFALTTSSTVIGGSLAAGQTQTITIRYRPSLEGTRSATLNLTYSGKPMVSVSLVGTVDTSPLLELSTNQLTTPPVDLGATSASVRYDIRGEYLGSSVIVIATGDWQIARSSTANTSEWATRLEIPVTGNVLNTSLWVRFTSRREGLQTGVISHWVGSTSAPLAVSSFTNVSFLSIPATISLGTLTLGQTAIAQYFLQATNLSNSVQISAPTGATLALDDNGPWQKNLTLRPIDRTVSSTIFVRYETLTHGTITGQIIHTVGVRTTPLPLRGTVNRSPMNIQSSHLLGGVLNFGYVAPRYSSIATYWVEITNATTAVTIQAPEGFTVALADDGSWAGSVTIPPQTTSNRLLRRLVFVRFAPRFATMFSGEIVHSFNGTTATVRVFASSITPKLGTEISTIDFGKMTANTTATRSYRIQAEGITTPITIQMPSGLEATLSQYNEWRETLTLTPLLGQATVSVFVRTKPELATGKEYHATIQNTANENGFLVSRPIAVTANTLLPVVTTGTFSSTGSSVNSTNAINSSNQMTSIENEANRSDKETRSYPNPFSDAVSLSWNQKQTGSTSIVIRTANGALTRLLNVQSNGMGIQRTQWDGRDNTGVLVASGTYFAQIIIDGVPISQNIVLVVVR